MSRAMIPLEFHTGFDVTEKTTSKGEKLYETTCPSCGKENHFHVFETGQYNCKVCGESGNTYNLINLIYNKAIVDYRDMTKQRGLPQRALHGIKFNRFNNSFILPTYKNGKMNNLYKTGMNWRWMGTPGLGSTLFDWEEESNEDIWLCEGQWDKMAAVAIIGAARPISAIGLPGAGAMKDGWCHAFAGKNVTLIFDNDEAGVKGAEKTINVFKESAAKPRSISIVEWPETLSDGYDLRDFYQEHGKGSFERLKPLIKPVDVPAAIRLSSAPILEDTSC